MSEGAELTGCVLAFVHLSVASASLVVMAAFVVLGLFLYGEFVILPKYCCRHSSW